MQQQGQNVLVPTFGTVVIYPFPFTTTPTLVITSVDLTKTAQVVAPSNTQFTVFVLDSSGRSVGGQINWTATGT